MNCAGFREGFYLLLCKDLQTSLSASLFLLSFDFGNRKKAYANEKFVRLQPKGSFANIKNVRCSNYCDISLHFDSHTSTLIITSAIDNMVKGAAGQAIQNMNIRFGLPEDEAISMLAPSF